MCILCLCVWLDWTYGAHLGTTFMRYGRGPTHTPHHMTDPCNAQGFLQSLLVLKNGDPSLSLLCACRSYPNSAVLDIARVGLCLVVCMIYPIVGT